VFSELCSPLGKSVRRGMGIGESWLEAAVVFLVQDNQTELGQGVNTVQKGCQSLPAAPPVSIAKCHSVRHQTGVVIDADFIKQRARKRSVIG